MHLFLSISIITNFVFLTCSFTVLSQNLVINPSFEDTVTDYNPFNLTNSLYNSVAWKEINTANYFWYGNMDGIRNTKTIDTKPNSGQCFAGIYINSKTSIRSRECIIGSFENTLTKGCAYKIKLFVNFSDKYTYILKNIDVLFSAQTYIYNDTNSKIITLQKITKNNNGWDLFEGEYIATGKENFMFIGSFQENIEYKKNRNKNSTNKKGVFVFIDDVTVIPIDDCHKYIDQIKTEKVISNNFSTTTKNIYFKFDSFKIDSSYMTYLDSIIDILNDNVLYQIEIIGYSDTIGKDDYNADLSYLRAKNVATFLIEKGIDEKRITYYGKGSHNNIYEADWKLRKVELNFKSKTSNTKQDDDIID